MTIIFAEEVKGHYLEYLHHIYDKCKVMNGEYLFYVPEQFKDIKKLFTWDHAPNIKFEYITNDVYHCYMSMSIIRRSFYLSKLLLKLISKHKACRIFCCTLMSILPFAPFLIRSKVKISGIIYMIYLHKWNSLSFVEKVINVLKYVLMSYCRNIENILILNDKESVYRLRDIYKSNKYSYLPDPYVPLKSTGSYQSIKRQYNIGCDKVIFSHFGALNSNKGSIELLKSLEKLPQEVNQRSHFFIAGKVDKEIKEEFYNIYNRIKTDISITLMDEFCEYEFIGNLCKESTAIIIPYKRTSQSSGVIGYASQFGKPVIAPKQGLLGTLVREYELGLTIPDLSADSLIQAYKEIIDNGNYTPSTKYCNSHTVEAFQNVISSII